MPLQALEVLRQGERRREMRTRLGETARGEKVRVVARGVWDVRACSCTQPCRVQRRARLR